MDANERKQERDTASTQSGTELENTLVSLLFVLLTACLFLLIGTADARHRIDEPSREVIETEVVHRDTERQSVDS